MTKHAFWAIAAALLFSTSSGCVWWRHCWGSWAYYGTQDSCGYCDHCPPGPCAKHNGPFGGLFRDCWLNHCGSACGDCGGCQTCNSCGGCANGGCANGCGGGCCDGGCGACNSCGNCDGIFHGFFHNLFYTPHPVGPTCYGCQGCGEFYWCDWANNPPTPDPCDCCGNYTGSRVPLPCYQQSPRYGSLPMHSEPPVAAETIEAPTETEAPTPAAELPPMPRNGRHPTGVERATYRGQRPLFGR